MLKNKNIYFSPDFSKYFFTFGATSFPKSSIALRVSLCSIEPTGKCKIRILLHLVQNEKMRFSELKRAIPNITEKMLIKNLRELEIDDLVYRVAYPCIPPKVEYFLSDHGKELIPILDKLHEWGIKHREHIYNKNNTI